MGAQPCSPQLSRTPARPLLASCHDRVLQPSRHRLRTSVRATRSVDELAARHKAIHPLVARLAADSVLPAEFRETALLLQVLVDELLSLLHGRDLLPRQG